MISNGKGPSPDRNRDPNNSTLIHIAYIYLATYYFHIVHTEDGNFNAHRNTVTASTHDTAKPQKLRVDMQKNLGWEQSELSLTLLCVVPPIQDTQQQCVYTGRYNKGLQQTRIITSGANMLGIGQLHI